MVEHLLCKQGVRSSNLLISTKKDADKLSASFFVDIRQAGAWRLPFITLHPQGTGERIPPHGFAVPLRSGLRPPNIVWFRKRQLREPNCMRVVMIPTFIWFGVPALFAPERYLYPSILLHTYKGCAAERLFLFPDQEHSGRLRKDLCQLSSGRTLLDICPCIGHSLLTSFPSQKLSRSLS